MPTLIADYLSHVGLDGRKM